MVILGRYQCQFHTGIDFPKSQMSDARLYACCTGTVVQVFKGNSGHNCRALGNEVDIQRDGDGLIFRYCHMEFGSNDHINVGQRVDTNTYIGITGDTGNSTGAHLHLECATSVQWTCQTFVNPR